MPWAGSWWNRAQRACFNTDESLPVFLSGLVLVALVYGPVAVALAAVNAAGRVAFARLYTESADAREAGFLPAIVAEHLSAALVLVGKTTANHPSAGMGALRRSAADDVAIGARPFLKP